MVYLWSYLVVKQSDLTGLKVTFSSFMCMMVLWLSHYLCAYTDEQEFQKEKEGKKYLQNIGNWNKWSAIWSDIICMISQSNGNAAQVDLRSQVWFRAKILRHKVTLCNQFWNCKVSFTSYIVRLSHEKAPHRNPRIKIVCVHFPWDNLYLPMKLTFLCIKIYFFISEVSETQL